MVSMTEAQKAEFASAEKVAFEAEAQFEQVVGRRAMRRCGVTLLDIRRRVKAMTRAGELTLDMTRDQIRETVLDDIYADNPHIYEAIDWDALLAFIEKLIPLIMQLISLFM